jgi:hypothetical protein
VLLEPFGNFRTIETKLTPNFLTGNLTPLSHPLSPTLVHSQQTSYFLNTYYTVGHNKPLKTLKTPIYDFMHIISPFELNILY